MNAFIRSHPRSRRIAFLIVLGIGSVLLACSGGSASTVSSTQRPLPSVMACSGKVQRPTSYVMLCTSGAEVLKTIHWTSWTAQKASATAIYSSHGCSPNCATAKWVNYSASVRFSSPVSTKYGLLFTIVRISYSESTVTKLTLTEKLATCPTIVDGRYVEGSTIAEMECHT